MFTLSLLNKTPEEAIQNAYEHFEELAEVSSFSEEAKIAIYTVAIRTYCYDHDAIVEDDDIHAFLKAAWTEESSTDYVA